jgi:hypothetical protein
MYEEYRRRCKAEPRQFNLGDCWLWKADGRPWVFNLATQEGYWRARASYEAVEASLRAMRGQADAEGVTTIAAPRIGVGYGGLSWKKVRAIIETVFAGWPGTLVVYEEFVPGDASRTPGAEPTTQGVLFDVGDDPARSRRPRRGRVVVDTPVDAPEAGGRDGVIHFYSVKGEYGCFSNFSPHPVELKGRTWPTSEHYFQAQKFAGTPDETEVRRAKSPAVAARMGRSRKRPLRKDWEAVKDRVMHEAVC